MLRDPDNQRLLDGIGLQHDRGHVMRFLKTEGVEPTNNRAERILRPAVIARKVSHCSKNQPGANAFAAFTKHCANSSQEWGCFCRFRFSVLVLAQYPGPISLISALALIKYEPSMVPASNCAIADWLR